MVTIISHSFEMPLSHQCLFAEVLHREIAFRQYKLHSGPNWRKLNKLDTWQGLIMALL